MIKLNGVTKIYNQGRPNEVTAVSHIDLTVAAGVTVLKGPSGSGKTTLLTLIGCLARPTTGRVLLNGEVISGLPEKFLNQIRRKTFGFVFQQHNLIRGVSALENVMVPAFPLGEPRGSLKSRALDLLALMQVQHREATPVELLSGGEAQRVAIARALINEPETVIADEPTANLDTRLTEQFLDIVSGLKARGKSVLMSSHDPRIWQAPVVDRVVSMSDGRIEDAGDIVGGTGAEGVQDAESGEDAR
ncbi:MAG: ABC transporter ATP-binding protein [Alphaproteobacteria bacterium]